MATVNLTVETFQTTVEKPGITFVDWWAGWCNPCMRFAPIYEAASERHPDITFAKIDTEAEQQLSAAAQITSIPNLMIFRDGILVFNEPGALPADKFEEMIESARALDMDEIRATLAEAETQADTTTSAAKTTPGSAGAAF